jgi:hypothetical protein
MSPNTLHGMLQDSDLGGVAVPKKRKHLKKSDHNNVGASNSQPPPRAPHAPGNRRATCYAHSHQSDGFALVWKSWRPFHVAGETMLPPSVLDKVPLELKVLNDNILHREKYLMTKQNKWDYPVWTVQVPTGFHFYDIYPTDKFYLRFEEIFNMMHLKKTGFAMVGLFTLHLAYALKDNVTGIAVVDPYLMVESKLHTPMGRRTTTDYLGNFLWIMWMQAPLSCLTFLSKSFCSRRLCDYLHTN